MQESHMDIIVQNREQILLRALVLDDLTGENLSELFRDLDFQRERMEYPLLLSVLGQRTGWRSFPEDVTARLEGVNKAARLRNIHAVPWLIEKIRLLSEHEIPVLLLKGIAMRSYYAPELPRQMSDFDLAVPEDKFEEAKQLLADSEHLSELPPESLHAVHIKSDNGVIDLHHWIFKTKGGSSAGIWKRAVPSDRFGVRAFVPDSEDMFIHLLDSRVRDEIRTVSPERRVKWLLDAALVLRSPGTWDWSSVAERSKELGSLMYLEDALPVFSGVFPELLSQSELENYFPQDDAFLEWKERTERYKAVNRDYFRNTRSMNRYTPEKILRMLKYYRSAYRDYYGPELKEAGEVSGFLDFLVHLHHVRNVPELITKFIKSL